MNTSYRLPPATNYSHLFSKLDRFLSDHKALWDVQSFHDLDWPWRKSHPSLCEWLSDFDGVPTDREVESELKRLLPSFNPVEVDWQSTLNQPLPQPSSHFMTGIKGRKWQQIEAFSQHIQPISPVVEWCAGKGHLGKLIAFQHAVEVHSLEWQKSLCESGQQEAKQRNLNQYFTHADVLKGEGIQPLKSANSAVALHACGDLHSTLIKQGIESELSYFAISPCCYHLTQFETYQPLSLQAKQALTSLSQENLKLAVKEVATAGQREQRLKTLELSYRLGFDAWQRQATGSNHYLNVPSCSKVLLNQGFEAFAHWAAEQKSLHHLIGENALDGFEAVGYARSLHVAKVEAVTQYFRRSLELWLVLDRALCLEEAAYAVSVEVFCDKHLTPRNFLITAKG